MDLPFYWIDAFTDRVFGGNPAAVVPLAEWLPDALLQKIANENGLSETAYFVRTGDARAQIRWFTPQVEMDLCGHATLGTAHVLFNELGQVTAPFIFDSKSGALSVGRKGDLFELDLPARPAEAVAPPAPLIKGLGRRPAHVLRTDLVWLCVYETTEEVTTLAPDHAALAMMHPGRIIITGPGADCDFVSRFFAPEVGIVEDPVTGSAHCTLVPYWAARLGKSVLHARQVSRRGGELWCELDGERVRIAGRSSLYLKGSISV